MASTAQIYQTRSEFAKRKLPLGWNARAGIQGNNASQFNMPDALTVNLQSAALVLHIEDNCASVACPAGRAHVKKNSDLVAEPGRSVRADNSQGRDDSSATVGCTGNLTPGKKKTGTFNLTLRAPRDSTGRKPSDE